MSQQIVEQQQPELFPWGEANPKRGLPYHETAVKYGETFPFYTIISKETFDKWTNTPINGETEDSIKTGATRAKINNAASHPRMGEKAFQIIPVGRGQFQTVPITEVVSMADVPAHIARYVEGQLRKINHWLQGVPIENLAEVKLYAIQSYYDDILSYKKRLTFETDTLEHSRIKTEQLFKLSIAESGERKAITS